MEQKYKKNSYEEAFYGFQERGLYLDEPKETFVHNQKSDCHCLKHPDNKMKYAWCYVKMGRFSCKECKKETPYITRTDEEKIQAIENLVFTYVDGKLSSITNPLTIKCKHGHSFKRSLNALERGNTDCPFCIGKIPTSYWNLETCREWLKTEMPDYTILDAKKENYTLKVFMKCSVPSHEPYWTSWGHVKNGKTGCKMCYYDRENKTDWTLDNARKYLKENGYEMLDESEYISSHEPVYCRDELGFIYQVRVHFLVRGRTGFSLLRNNKYAVHNIRHFLSLYRPDYEFVDDEYKGNKRKHYWKYIGEGLPEGTNRVFEQTVSAMLYSYCKHPVLSKSQLEAHCQFILDKYNLKYEDQKTFEGCVGKNKLRYDYYLELNGKKYCIEVDGLQHEIPIEKFGGIIEFQKRRKHDEIKNKYCEDNGIELIRIKQKEYKNMENIIVERLGLIGEVVKTA